MQIRAYEFTCAVDAHFESVLQRHVKEQKIPVADIISVTKREDGRWTGRHDAPVARQEAWVIVWREGSREEDC